MCDPCMVGISHPLYAQAIPTAEHRVWLAINNGDMLVQSLHYFNCASQRTRIGLNDTQVNLEVELTEQYFIILLKEWPFIVIVNNVSDVAYQFTFLGHLMLI